MNFLKNLITETVDVISKTKDYIKEEGNKIVESVGGQVLPVPQQDQFHINGELSPDQFKRAGNKLINICTSWQWRPSASKNICKHLDPSQQYLALQKVNCYKRLSKIPLKSMTVEGEEQNTEDFDCVIVEAPQQKEQKIEETRLYTMYIIYDEYYHTPRMYFSATDLESKPISNTDIKQDIQEEYADKTVTAQAFPFLEGVTMPTVHPCKHASVLKMMADSMAEEGTQIKADYALLIFLQFFTSVIPTVEFLTTGDLHFN